MTGRVVAHLVSIALTALAAWVVPAVGMRALMPALERSAPRVRNYRGHELPVGLGLVWLLWAAGLFLAAGAGRLAMWMLNAAPGESREIASGLFASYWPLRGSVMITLVVAAFAFGLVDDVFGDASAKGFRGHLRALRREGRLTTGLLKMLGIGAAAAWASLGMAMTDDVDSWASVGLWSVRWVLLTVVIALSANLLNLLDLRPGRALKAYLLLVVPAALAVAGVAMRAQLAEAAGTGAVAPWLEPLAAGVGLLLVVVGPAVAVWRLDLCEHGMLGDGGANPAGALCGFLFASVLDNLGLALVAVILLGLNLASERVSFTTVIAESGMLTWVDRLGRLHHEQDGRVGNKDREDAARAADGADSDSRKDGES